MQAIRSGKLVQIYCRYIDKQGILVYQGKKEYDVKNRFKDTGNIQLNLTVLKSSNNLNDKEYILLCHKKYIRKKKCRKRMELVEIIITHKYA